MKYRVYYLKHYQDDTGGPVFTIATDKPGPKTEKVIDFAAVEKLEAQVSGLLSLSLKIRNQISELLESVQAPDNYMLSEIDDILKKLELIE